MIYIIALIFNIVYIHYSLNFKLIMMKKTMIFSVILSFMLVSCNGQNNTERTSQKKDTIKPEIGIKVHKEYDDDGNLIRVDSSYTYFYSNIKNDSLLEKEIFDNFKFDFNSHFKSLDSLLIEDFFIQEPFNLDNFYTDEFFKDNFKLHQKRIDDILRQMDSLKNSYYNKQKKSMITLPDKM